MLNSIINNLPQASLLKLPRALCFTLLLTGAVAQASAREVEVINYSRRRISLCYRWTKTTWQTGAGGSSGSNSYVIQGWRTIKPQSSHKITVKGNEFWVLIRDANGRYLTYSMLPKDEHFVHPHRVFNNIVTGSRVGGKDKGKLQAGDGGWIEYGTNGHSTNRPLQFGFERHYFFKWPYKTNRIEFR